MRKTDRLTQIALLRLRRKQRSDDDRQRSHVTFEACDHRREHLRRVELGEVEGVARTLGKQAEKRYLSAAVAFAKRMNGVDLGEIVRGPLGKALRGLVPKMTLSRQGTEKFAHLRVDVLRVTEHAVVLGDAYRPELSGPVIHVLEEMPVNGPVMGKTEPAGRQSFPAALLSDERFESLQFGLAADVELVLENYAMYLYAYGLTAEPALPLD